MTVIPCVIVHKRRSIGHASNLITIIPPGHNPGKQKDSDQLNIDCISATRDSV